MKGIVIALAVASVLGLLSLVSFTPQHALLIAVTAFLVALWTNEALPMGVVSLLPVLLFPMLGILDTAHVTANYSKSIIFLFLGGFLMAIAIEKTGLHRYFSAKLLAFFPHTPRGIVYALAITSALLSSFLSNTTITLMLIPVALFLSEQRALKVRFLLATAYGASIGGILTPIGTPPNLILLGFLEDRHLPTLGFGEWMVLTAPIVALMLLVMPWFLSAGVSHLTLESDKEAIPPLTEAQKRLMYVLGLLVVILLANTFLKQRFGFTLNEKSILLAFGLSMFLPGLKFLTWEDTRNLPYEVIFLFGAGFSIAAAFTQTGLSDDIAHKLAFITQTPFLAMIFIVAAFVTFSTEVTSNTALTSIALPVFYAFVQDLPQAQVSILLLVATVAASYAFMLPIATPPNAIVMSSRVIKVKEIAAYGFWLNLTGIVVLSLCAYFWWPLWSS